MNNHQRYDGSSQKEMNRIEAFSDNIFAIAITLLGLNLTPSSSLEASKLLGALFHLWPAYLAFLMSFITILIVWINHHTLFKLVQRTNTLFLFVNGFLLLLVTAVPFPTALVAQYLTTPAAPLVSALYAGFFLVVNLAFNLLWWSAAYQFRLLRREIAPSRVRKFTSIYLFGFPCYLGAMFLA
ncbi:MAG TPA: TMEM175 family protein, partial [Ktedonobacteraceae bacterium]|nr:TMEM175 family protein [Ktedonobacteraceae bacterium]